MKKIVIALMFSVFLISPLEACPCDCGDRYYNPSWADEEGIYYGYTDMNDYPYSLPVNYYFNPCSCSCYDYNYLMWCIEQSECDD